ncbi:MAG: ParB/RepB/Spo0J family partition protein [Planctomycetes bacterium]|nr:ParB/RepB/Spo0J family partition protein [Planctomycetota bacterium]
MAERRLGRGLDFFLSGSPAEETGSSPGESVQSVPLDKIVPNPHQPRREFADAELKELAASIREAGLLQPILLRRVGEQFQIIAGERRWRAARIAGLEAVPALVRDASDEQAAVFALIENLQREDLNPIEKAQAFRRIQQLGQSSQEELARHVGLDRSTVSNFLRLLELPGEVQAHVSRGTLSMGHARALLAAPDAGRRKELAERAIRDRLSVRQVESLAQAAKTDSTEPATSAERAQPVDKKDRPLWLKEIEDTLTSIFEANVQVRYGRRRSRITIECDGRTEFERVYELLRGAAPERR